MKRELSCYCGFYCENCAVMAKVTPAARTLYNEMSAAGFKEVMPLLPGGKDFWSILYGFAINDACISCRADSGDPNCRIRACAKEKGHEMCAFCESYPCELFDKLLSEYPILIVDNDLLREKGWLHWLLLQSKRRAVGFVIQDTKARPET